MEILIIFVLIGLNGFLAMAEIAILSAPKSRIKTLADNGNKNAQTALSLIDNSSKFLSSIQIGITLIGVVAGAFGGHSLAEPLANNLAGLGILSGYHELVAYIIVVVSITYFSIVFGELVPKRLAISNSVKLALISAPWVYRISQVSALLVKILSVSTNIVVSLIPLKNKKLTQVSEEEVISLIHEGVVLGVFEPTEKRMFERMLLVGDTPVSEMMVPLNKVVWLDTNESTEKWRQTITKHPHYYYPVYQGSAKNVVGIIRAEDILTDFLDDIEITIEDILLKPHYVQAGQSGLAALEQYRLSGIHLAFVQNDNQEIIGIITSNDIMEAIAGGLTEIDEMATVEDMQESN